MANNKCIIIFFLIFRAQPPQNITRRSRHTIPAPTSRAHRYPIAPMPIPASSATASPPVPVTTRSRTLLFFSFRDSTARPRRARPRVPYGAPEAAPDHFDEERQGLLPPSPSRAASPGLQRQLQSLQDDTLPPRWSVLLRVQAG
jgi:hypothetical protein